jgi:hypothetical protein
MPPLVPSIELAGLLLEGDTALTLSSGITIGVCQAHMTGQYRSATWISFTPLQFYSCSHRSDILVWRFAARGAYVDADEPIQGCGALFRVR